jgi:transglutaminase/protease-like cytokinesis protein 3
MFCRRRNARRNRYSMALSKIRLVKVVEEKRCRTFAFKTYKIVEEER